MGFSSVGTTCQSCVVAYLPVAHCRTERGRGKPSDRCWRGQWRGDARFSSIPAKALFARCHKAFKPFNEREATRIAQNRNEYLHGPAPGFVAIPEDSWWARFWAQAVILVEHIDNDIDGLVGSDRVEAVEQYLALNTRNIEQRVESLLEHARQRLVLRSSSNPPAWIEREFDRAADLTASLGYSSGADCPACGSQGHLEGSEVSSSDIKFERVSEDDYEQWVDLTVDSEYFSCPNCRLVLNGYELVEYAGLATAFGAVGDMADFAGDEYGND